MSATRIAALSVVLYGAVACSFGESRHVTRDTKAGATVTASVSSGDSGGLSISASAGTKARRGGPTFAEGPGGEAWIATTDGTLLMGIRHDSILLAFSDSLRKAVKTEVDTSMKRDIDKEGDAIGKAIGGIVQGTVKAALTEVFDKERGFPLSDVKDVRYDDGEIVFDYRHKPMIRPESIKNDAEPMTKRFHPADAARFVGAVRARLNASR